MFVLCSYIVRDNYFVMAASSFSISHCYGLENVRSSTLVLQASWPTIAMMEGGERTPKSKVSFPLIIGRPSLLITPKSGAKATPYK